MPKPTKKSPKPPTRSSKRNIAETSFTASLKQPKEKKQQTDTRTNNEKKSHKTGEVSIMATTDQLMQKLNDMSIENAAARVVANEILSKLTNVETELTKINTKLIIHDNEIACLKNSQTNASKEILLLKTKVSYFEQKDLDNKLVIVGFKKLPGEHELIKLCQLFEFHRTSITYASAYQMGQRAGSLENNNQAGVIKMVLSFSCKETQMEFRSASIRYGPVNLSSVLEADASYSRAVTHDANSVLKITNVYTSANRKINWMLHQLLLAKKIHAIRYRNCTFHYQVKPTSPPIPVGTIETADEIVKDLTADLDQTMG